MGKDVGGGAGAGTRYARFAVFCATREVLGPVEEVALLGDFTASPSQPRREAPGRPSAELEGGRIDYDRAAGAGFNG